MEGSKVVGNDGKLNVGGGDAKKPGSYEPGKFQAKPGDMNAKPGAMAAKPGFGATPGK